MSDAIPGVVLTKLDVHADDRGRFVEVMRASGAPASYVQTNHSRSARGVLRGLHYHRRQADLWCVTNGRIQVAVADLSTPTDEPATASFILDGNDPATLYIPEGVAHGYFAITEAEILYHHTNEYDGSDEFGIAWNDPTLSIRWETDSPILSARDAANPELRWDEIPSF